MLWANLRYASWLCNLLSNQGKIWNRNPEFVHTIHSPLRSLSKRGVSVRVSFRAYFLVGEVMNIMHDCCGLVATEHYRQKKTTQTKVRHKFLPVKITYLITVWNSRGSVTLYMCVSVYVCVSFKWPYKFKSRELSEFFPLSGLGILCPRVLEIFRVK